MEDQIVVMDRPIKCRMDEGDFEVVTMIMLNEDGRPRIAGRLEGDVLLQLLALAVDIRASEVRDDPEGD